MADAAHDKASLRVFISYAREDIGFADQLDAALDGTGFTATVDRHDIPGAEEWTRRLLELIRDADTIVFVLSPTSAQSKWCSWEVERAIEHGKRIIPIVCKPLSGTQVPQPLTSLNYIYFYDDEKAAPDGGFGTGLAKLIRALNEDPVWLREHTRLLGLALQWEGAGRPTNRLLSGDDVGSAKAWLGQRSKSKTEPTELHLDFIRASEAEDLRRKNFALKEVEERERLVKQTEFEQTARAEAQSREIAAQRAKNRNTWIGAGVATALAITAGWFGYDATEKSRQLAIEKAAVEVQRNAAETARASAERQAERLKLSMLEALTEPTAVGEALDFMIGQEIGSQAAYTAKFSKPTWPGGQSGVTIGFGYDLGYVSETQFESDWGSILPKETLDRLRPAIAVRGDAADRLAEQFATIEVPFAVARQSFLENTVPKYLRRMMRTFPGAAELPFACQAALLSLVYNRGGSLNGDRNREMRDIRDAIAANKVETIAVSIRQMKRLWPEFRGLVDRRETEALLCEKSILLREKVLRVLSEPER